MPLELSVSQPRSQFTLEIDCSITSAATGVFGRSGAGKSSLFHLIAGLESPTRGKIVLNGRILFDSEAGINVPIHRRRVGIVFQEKYLFPHLSVRENLLFAQRYNRNSPTVDAGLVIEMLELGGILDSYPEMISGGEQQRAALGRSLLASPELLLLDEPFHAVHSQLRYQILPCLRRLREEMDIPFLVISHDPRDLVSLVDEVIVFEAGRIVNRSPIDGWEIQIEREESMREQQGRGIAL